MGRANEDEQMHSNMCIRVKERTTEEQGGELKCKGQHWPKNKLISLQWKLKKVAKLQNHSEEVHEGLRNYVSELSYYVQY